ncbi:The BTB (BR-C, ttk and bab)/POZ (Pox virus and Zinc finger) domain [Ceratobasidium sp. AG-Ba]|nr:The BTB (BR-C, ttk and bab)/POZ (Pox virus and Zinc finger) domain [Ceratobasidium sp. AG-Ba]
MQSYTTLYPSSNTQPSCVYDDAGRYNFPDGDVSLLVEQTSFRVHRDKLVRHSHVFNDMFVVAHPDDDEDEEFQPLDTQSVSVRMPDTAEEWGLVFSVIYPHKDRPSGANIASLRDIAIALRMAEKYDVADVHSWAAAHFNYRYPSSLVYLSPNDTLIETASLALNLAKMYGVSSVLPSIYFALAKESWHIQPDELRQLLSRWLEPEDVERIIAGRNILWKRTLIVRHEAQTNPSPMLAPYCTAPGPSGHIIGGYTRASRSCREILAERMRDSLGVSDPTRASPQMRGYPLPSAAGRTRSPSPVATKGRRMSSSGFLGAKQGSNRHLLDALQVLEEMDDLDIVIWPSPVCHVCSLVHSRWVTQTNMRTVSNMLEAFQT